MNGLKGESQRELNLAGCPGSYWTYGGIGIYTINNVAEARSIKGCLRQAVLRVVKDVEEFGCEIQSRPLGIGTR